MTIYELEKKATPAPFIAESPEHDRANCRIFDEQDVTVGLLYQQPLDDWTAEANAQLLTHCRNHFMEALALAKRLHRERDDEFYHGGPCHEIPIDGLSCCEDRKLIAKLENVEGL
jgi:hypothetical protein